MKTLSARLALIAVICGCLTSFRPIFAQGTAFTYQGQLVSGGLPANGNYDFTFALFNNAGTNTGQVGATLTNLDLGLTNGLFIVTLDFGSAFTGNAAWLAIGVRSNGGVNFTALNPLQALTPTPYAIYTPNAGAAGSANSVAGSNIVGSIAVANLPGIVITNGENGVNFSGAFTGNGVGLTNLNGANLIGGSVNTAQLAGGTLAAPASVAGTNFNATANTSYVVTNASATAINLPTNANLGDVVQITAEGAGGWTVLVQGSPNQSWTLTSAPANANWGAAASSSDGTHLVAAVRGGGIYTSTNSGTNWTEQTSAPTNVFWYSMASSSDGTHLVVGTDQQGIYISTNSGTNWTQQTPATIAAQWPSVASSSDGSHLIAVALGGGIYTSTNFGTTWTEQTQAPTNAAWYGVASSSDGTHLVAVVNFGGIYTSTNSGTNWAEQTAPGIVEFWSLASSSDGTHLVAAVLGGGGIYTSANSGTNWTQQTAPTSVSWTSVASSSDGMHLLAVASPGGIYASANFGTNWAEQTQAPTNANWGAVASSSDGTSLVAVASGGGIYINPDFVPATNIAGAQGTSRALQYLGNGQWSAVNSSPVGVVTNTETGVTLGGTFSGTLSGNGGGLTSLNPANLSAGTAAINISGNAATAAKATNVVAGISITNAALTNSTFAGTTIASTWWNATNLIATAGPLPLTNTYTSHGGRLVVFSSGSGYGTFGATIGMLVQMDGKPIGTNNLFLNFGNSHLAFVPGTFIVSPVTAGNHTFVLTPTAGTTNDFNDYFNLTVQELPFP